ncbi:MAG: tyrosine--tRNA ligase [Clostridia bacterium]|nr:tyrosine--tRNA ligase [Clostridia bacterium]
MGIYEELIERGLIAQVTDEDEIKELVNSGKAVFYIGFDPTADSLHVGHFMALCLMKRLQMAGNKPVALVGGGTGMIGDPSGRNDMRNMMTNDTIDYNCECFKKQMSRFIEFGEGEGKAIMVNNADWLRDLNFMAFMRTIGVHFNVATMLRSRAYENRMGRDGGLTFFEMSYMLLQGYDFYKLHKDYGVNMQFGGDDQWSNMLAGTNLIRKMDQEDSYAMTITLLTNHEGKKMGKTVGGAVWLDPEKTSPYDFYQYWRNIDDADVNKCLRMLTFIPLDEIKEIEKWDDSRINEKKELLAHELTELVHGKEEADKAQEAARALFTGGGDLSNMPTTEMEASRFEGEGMGLVALIHELGLVSSNSDGFRTIEQGGLLVNDEKITDKKQNVTLDMFKDDALLIKKGKKKFHRVLLKK